ncbi:MAG: alpha/beta hydrolase [Phenylobacterium zucineum]|nr:MAG: alpha/beta hydrolase [Phenylobacterium zucineum]
MNLKTLLITLALAVAGSNCVAQAQPLLTYHDILALPHGAPKQRIAYGPSPQQFGELWMPISRGPHPLVIMIHGGCWRADLPGLELQSPLSETLAAHGWAVWNLEYRRLGHDGAGYPGSFQDVGKGIDLVRRLAKSRNIDLKRVIFMGHSAGGHLAAWAAGRANLPATSPLFGKAPFVPSAVVTLAGINDLEAYKDHGPDACGGPDTINRLTGFGVRGPSAYLDTSPPHLLPMSRGQLVVSGALDPIVPSSFGEKYGSTAMKSGDPVQVLTIEGAGHFELIDPRSSAWTRLFPLVDALGGLGAKP